MHSTNAVGQQFPDTPGIRVILDLARNPCLSMSFLEGHELPEELHLEGRLGLSLHRASRFYCMLQRVLQLHLCLDGLQRACLGLAIESEILYPRSRHMAEHRGVQTHSTP